MKMFSVLDSVLIYCNGGEMEGIKYNGICGECSQHDCCPMDNKKRIIIITEEDKENE